MEQIIEWATRYSLPVLLLLILGVGVIFAIRLIVEKAVESQFDKRSKRIELLLERRSSFEEKILLDQYSTIIKLQSRLGKIGADLNRMRSGTEVKGLMVDGDIVPLTEVYIELSVKRFLLKKEFHGLLKHEADNLLAFANTTEQEEVKRLGGEYLELNKKFHEEMNRSFGIDKITWSTLELARQQDV